MLMWFNIPLLFKAISVVWGLVAYFRGQGMVPTLWGWWLMFQFPLAGVFAYLKPAWKAAFPDQLRRTCLVLLGLEVVVQLGQYALGEPPGDHLAGTFGRNGTGHLVLFILFTVCLCLGEWIMTRRGKNLALALGLGMASSVLGEMKLFPVGVALLGGLGMVFYAARHRVMFRLALYVIPLVIGLAAFVAVYNAVIPDASQWPLDEYLRDPQTLLDYLNRKDTHVVDGMTYTDMGRNYALKYGWETLQGKGLTPWFGWGLGTRGESVTLGTMGIGLSVGRMGASAGTSLLIMMQETGVVGLVLLAACLLGICTALIRELRLQPEHPVSALRWAVLLFTLLWPLWLWYGPAWTSRAPMMLYWMALGYLFSLTRHKANGYDGQSAREDEHA